MAYEVFVDPQDKGLVWSRLYDDAGWGEYHAMNDEVFAYVRSVNFRVDHIILVENPPPKDNPIPHVQRSTRLRSQLPNFGCAVSVYKTSTFNFIQMIGNIVVRARKSEDDPRVYFTYSEEEALKIIHADRGEAAATTG